MKHLYQLSQFIICDPVHDSICLTMKEGANGK